MEHNVDLQHENRLKFVKVVFCVQNTDDCFPDTVYTIVLDCLL